MLKYTVEFILTNHRFEFEIKSHKKEFLDAILDDLFSIFSTYDSKKRINTINGVVENNKEFQEKFQQFVNKYVEGFPELNGVHSQLKKLSEDEIFLFVPANTYAFKDRTILQFYLKSRNNNDDFELLKNEFEKKFRNIIDNY